MQGAENRDWLSSPVALPLLRYRWNLMDSPHYRPRFHCGWLKSRPDRIEPCLPDNASVREPMDGTLRLVVKIMLGITRHRRSPVVGLQSPMCTA